MNKEKIGIDAGVVWRLMDQSQGRSWSYAELKEATGLPDVELYAAIGWLARENKLEFEDDPQTEGDRVFLNVCYFF